jgi:hypothetical protein
VPASVKVSRRDWHAVGSAPAEGLGVTLAPLEIEFAWAPELAVEAAVFGGFWSGEAVGGV